MLTILIFYVNSVLLIKLKYKDKFKSPINVSHNGRIHFLPNPQKDKL